MSAADFVFDSTANDKGTVAEEGAQVVSGQLTPNGATSWDIVGGQRVLPTNFEFAIDEFSVNKNGTLIFDDTFGTTAPPDGPNFLTGTTPSPIYHTTGGFADSTDGNNNQVAQITSDNAAFSGLRGPGYIFGDFATLNTNTRTAPANFSNGLKSGQTFDVSGLFDLVVPDSGESYGIRLSDRASSLQPGTETVELAVIAGVTPGTAEVQLRQIDFATNTGTVLATFTVNNLNSDNQILLQLANDPSAMAMAISLPRSNWRATACLTPAR